jgi:hypothetical protein
VKDKVRAWFLLFALIAACSLGFITYRFSREELMIDRCLSTYHGSFNYSNMTCDLETNHPYVSYQARHPSDAAVAFVSFLLLLSGYHYARTSRERSSSEKRPKA